MQAANLMEITITHNLREKDEVAELFRRQMIALDWDRKGPDPELYDGRAKRDVLLFHAMRKEGAAVIAAYKTVTPNRADRLIGLVERGAKFVRVNGLLCLPLSKARTVDSSKSFLGNLAPRQCTVQTCSNRAKGRLASQVLGETCSARTIASLHHHDVEWLVTNYLIAAECCQCVWSGGRSYEDIDHAAIMPNGKELLAQTTISSGRVKNKAARLLQYSSPSRELYFFGPEESASDCPNGVAYKSIEKVFSWLDATPGGKWLIDRMLAASSV